MVKEVFDEHKLPDEFASKVIEGVPTLGWGKQRECTFLGALEAALAVTNHPARYTDLMGWSGMAFRVRWFAGNEKARWCPSCAVGEMEEEIQAVEHTTGWPLRISFVEKENAAAMQRLTADFVASINAGRPVLAYEPRGNMDVVFGYQDGGKILLLRDYFQPDTPLQLAASELGFLVLFLGEHGEGMPRPEALVRSLRIAVRNWRRERFAEGPGEYWYGEAALNRWRADIAEADSFSDEEKGQLCFVGRWNYSTMHDARLAAVSFLRESADLLPSKGRQALERAAQLYQQEAEFLSSALASRDAFTGSCQDWSAPMRRREQELLSQAQGIEESAISFLEKALP